MNKVIVAIVAVMAMTVSMMATEKYECKFSSTTKSGVTTYIAPEHRGDITFYVRGEQVDAYWMSDGSVTSKTFTFFKDYKNGNRGYFDDRSGSGIIVYKNFTKGVRYFIENDEADMVSCVEKPYKG